MDTTLPGFLAYGVGDKTKAIAEFLGLWSHVFSQDHGWQFSCLGVNLPSQSGSPWFWTALCFMITYLDPKVSTKALLSRNGCQITVVGWELEEEYEQGMSYLAILLMSLLNP